MIVGIGIDLVEVSRMARALDRSGPRLLERLFTPEERAGCQALGGGAQRWAVRFAAKEAVLKALGTGWSGGVTWHDVEILRARDQPPRVRLGGKADRVARSLGGAVWHLSLTHQRTHAAAVAVLEAAPGGAPR